MTARIRRSRGSVLVEFCLVLPLFLLLLLGAIDWGWYFVVRQTVTNAVREGARVGAVAPAGTATTAATTAVQAYMQNALGTAYQPSGTYLSVNGTTCQVGGSSCVSVSVSNFPVVAGRPAGSITGLNAWTRTPTTISVTSEMRLEVQP